MQSLQLAACNLSSRLNSATPICYMVWIFWRSVNWTFTNTMYLILNSGPEPWTHMSIWNRNRLSFYNRALSFIDCYKTIRITQPRDHVWRRLYNLHVPNRVRADSKFDLVLSWRWESYKLWCCWCCISRKTFILYPQINLHDRIQYPSLLWRLGLWEM